jgi:hypothetical protein
MSTSSDDQFSEAAQLEKFFSLLPIFATRVGYRTDSTAHEQRIGEAAFRAHEAWLDAMKDPES